MCIHKEQNLDKIGKYSIFFYLLSLSTVVNNILINHKLTRQFRADAFIKASGFRRILTNTSTFLKTQKSQ